MEQTDSWGVGIVGGEWMKEGKGISQRKYLQFRQRWKYRQKPFASSHNQKGDNDQSKINKQPEVPENYTAWNSNIHGIKETVQQNNQTGKAVEGENLWRGGRPWSGSDLKGN